jgi:squalene synthase HpnC
VGQLAGSADDVLASRPLATAEAGENFPVALRLLPRELRTDLRRVYAVARTIDDIGDGASGDRTVILGDFESDLRLIWSTGSPRTPVLADLAPTVRAHGLSIDPFLALVEANRLDQVQSSYRTWADLRRYCALSADPIGRIVLALVGAECDERMAMSDDVCTALQLLEHCQDVGEDRRRGRTYLPLEDLAAHGVRARDLDLVTTSAGVRAVVAYEVARAESLLASGVALVGSLRGAGRLAVAGYVAGGFATAAALRSADFDVLAVAVTPRRRTIALRTVRLWSGRS